MKILFTIFCALAIGSVFGQDLKSIEQVLLRQFKQITYWRDYKSSSDTINGYDSLLKANGDFQALLLKYTGQHPPTIDLNFKKLDNVGLSIATSADSLFRIYSWDTYTGGTMHIFYSVYQYKVNGKVYSKTINETNDEGDPGSWYSNIYTLKSQGKTYYLGLCHAVYSTKDLYQGIKVFSIRNNSLRTDTKLIKTKTGMENELGFGFDLSSVVEKPERPFLLIRYDAASKTLSLPVVLESGRVTDKRIVYQFTGQYFEQKK